MARFIASILSQIVVDLKLVPYLKARIEEWERKSNTIKILVTGKTGTGKSTLINGIAGREVTKEGDTLDPQTSEVESHKVCEGETTLIVFDSPGLQDGTRNDAKYLADMKKKCKNVDLVIYCAQMSEDRFLVGGKDVNAIKLLDETFGHDLWKNTIFLLTFANDIMEDAKFEAGDDPKDQQQYFNKQLEDWEKLIYERLHTAVHVPKEIVDGIAVVPAGHKNQPILPDSSSPTGESHWLSRVWLRALASTKPQAQLALIKLNLHRIQTREEKYESDSDVFDKLISQHKLIFEQKGAELAKALGVPSKAAGELAGRLTGERSFLGTLFLSIAYKAGILREEFDEPMKG